MIKLQARNWIIRVALAVYLAVLAGCQAGQFQTPIIGQAPSPTVTATDGESAKTPVGTLPQVTRTPPGQEDNPVILAVVTGENGETDLQAAAELAGHLTEKSGYHVQAVEFSSTAEIIDGLNQQRVHMAWLQPLTYLYAQERGLADVGLLTRSFGVYLYGAQYIARTDSGFQFFFNEETGENSGGEEQALAQLAGSRPCWTEPGSPSGYVLPAGILAETGILTLDPVIARTHSGVIRAVYAGGICDFGSTFAFTGNPLTSSSLADLDNLQEEVQVIWRSEAVIPNVNLSFHPELPAGIRRAITDALLEVGNDEVGLNLMSRASGADLGGIQEYSDSIYDPLRSAVESSGTLLTQNIGR